MRQIERAGMKMKPIFESIGMGCLAAVTGVAENRGSQ